MMKKKNGKHNVTQKRKRRTKGKNCLLGDLFEITFLCCGKYFMLNDKRQCKVPDCLGIIFSSYTREFSVL